MYTYIQISWYYSTMYMYIHIHTCMYIHMLMNVKAVVSFITQLRNYKVYIHVQHLLDFSRYTYIC